jgi:hypothetical protein
MRHFLAIFVGALTFLAVFIGVGMVLIALPPNVRTILNLGLGHNLPGFVVGSIAGTLVYRAIVRRRHARA